ncbi:MAG: hypothetical protein JWQ38_3171 [Flavipsychrobacter sp.]|nr:hypothetical protein [Flavipsychrobacter sp.]
MKKAGSLLLFIFVSLCAHAQELFPVAEPASNVPKGALGVRAFSEGYKEADVFRKLLGVKLLYGVTPKLSVYLSVTASDYHEKTLPFDFIEHSHVGGQLVGGAGATQKGDAYPVVFNSIDAYAKYRFLSVDGQNTHYRLAAYAEASHVAVPSHEAEPDLLVHTSGVGAGVIGTYLLHHFATSVTVGGILPKEYRGNATDRYGGIYPTTIQYGNALAYSLSFGYLLWPKSYKSYDQTNWNIYMELTGRKYGAASVSQKDGPATDALSIPISSTTHELHAGSYLDINPGIQCIINSTYRIEASVGFALLNSSYLHQYPKYVIGMQRYFYFKTRTSAKEDKM